MHCLPPKHVTFIIVLTLSTLFFGNLSQVHGFHYHFDTGYSEISFSTFKHSFKHDCYISNNLLDPLQLGVVDTANVSKMNLSESLKNLNIFLYFPLIYLCFPPLDKFILVAKLWWVFFSFWLPSLTSKQVSHPFMRPHNKTVHASQNNSLQTWISLPIGKSKHALCHTVIVDWGVCLTPRLGSISIPQNFHRPISVFLPYFRAQFLLSALLQ